MNSIRRLAWIAGITALATGACSSSGKPSSTGSFVDHARDAHDATGRRA
jgi:hypothetical protein